MTETSVTCTIDGGQVPHPTIVPTLENQQPWRFLTMKYCSASTISDYKTKLMDWTYMCNLVMKIKLWSSLGPECIGRYPLRFQSPGPGPLPPLAGITVWFSRFPQWERMTTVISAASSFTAVFVFVVDEQTAPWQTNGPSRAIGPLCVSVTVCVSLWGPGFIRAATVQLNNSDTDVWHTVHLDPGWLKFEGQGHTLKFAARVRVRVHVNVASCRSLCAISALCDLDWKLF